MKLFYFLKHILQDYRRKRAFRRLKKSLERSATTIKECSVIYKEIYPPVDVYILPCYSNHN